MTFSPNSMYSLFICPKKHTSNFNLLNILYVLILSAMALVFMSGCAAGPARQPQEINQPPQPQNTVSISTAFDQKQLLSLPHYKNLADLLENKGSQKGVSFYLTPASNYILFALNASETFFIPDKTGTCLFQIGLLSDNQAASQQIISDISITPGPCGLKYPDTSAEVRKIVSTMAEEIVLPGLKDRLSGKPWIGECSDKNFLQQTLLQKMPYDIRPTATDLEGAISQFAINVNDPLEIAFGDVIFFPLQKNTNTVGIYMGYGLVVYHKDCSKAGVHRLTGGIQYRIYRPITGFAWTRYQPSDSDFLLNHLDAAK